MREFEYVPYGPRLDGVRHVFVDGLRAADTTLELSHWPGNRTPAALKGDVSTQAVLALLALGDAERDRLLAGATAVTCDHYDVDGLLSLWCLVRPDAAVRHRELVAGAALCGDFDTYTGAPAVRACLALLAAERAVQGKILADAEPRTVEEATASLFRGVLDLAEECLLAPESWREEWAAEWDDIERSRRYLRERPDAVVEDPRLDLAVCHDTEPPLHDYAVNERCRALHVLRLRPDGRHQLYFRYEGFVDLRTRVAAPRVRGDLLADRLGEAENGGGTWFCEPPSTATPLLQLYHGTDVPAASSYPAAEMARRVIAFFAEARADRSMQWSAHPDWFRETPVGPPSKETA